MFLKPTLVVFALVGVSCLLGVSEVRAAPAPQYGGPPGYYQGYPPSGYPQYGYPSYGSPYGYPPYEADDQPSEDSQSPPSGIHASHTASAFNGQFLNNLSAKVDLKKLFGSGKKP